MRPNSCKPLWLLMLALLISAVPVLAQDAAAATTTISDDTQTIELEYRTHRKWKLKLPAESFAPVGVGFAFEKTLGVRFVAKAEGTGLQIDSDGDGAVDVKVDGTDGFVTLTGKTREGRGFKYAVRLKNAAGWTFAPGGVLTGKINGTRIQIIDQNNNGSYADYGVDAMVVGRGKAASFLSRVVNVDGKVLEIDVAADGSTLTTKPYVGPVGELKLDMDTKAKVLSAVLKSIDGQHSFELSRAKGPMLVPTGKYLVHGGELGLGGNRMKFRRGNSKSVKVVADEPRTLGWGGPVKAEFAYQRQGGKVGLSPDAVWYYGNQGEEYYDFVPLGKSPKFTIANKKTGREIATAYFPGTC